MACGETQLITFTSTSCCHCKWPFSRQLSSLRGCEIGNNRREAPGLARRCPTTSSTRARTVGSRCDQSRWPSFPSSSTVKFESLGSNKQRTRPSADTPVLKHTQRCSLKNEGYCLQQGIGASTLVTKRAESVPCLSAPQISDSLKKSWPMSPPPPGPGAVSAGNFIRGKLHSACSGHKGIPRSSFFALMWFIERSP